MDEQFAHAVHCLHVLLLHRLHGHEVHRRPASGLDDGLRIIAVVLVGLHERRDVLRTDQPHLDTHRLEASVPVVRRATRLHRYHARPQGAHRLQETLARYLGAMQGAAASVRTVKLKHALGQVNAQNVDVHRNLQIEIC
jgi:hypothetical protein